MKMIEPAGIPQFIGDFEQLDKDVSALRSDAIGIRNGGADVHSRFQMLGAYYTAPEADDLFATTQPVMDRADTFAADLETVANALDTFSSEARPLAKRLQTLEADARKFVASVEGDDDWHYDEDKTDRNNELVDDVAVTKTAFEAAERRAATKISAIVNGPKFIEDDGSHKATKKTVMYGYDADVLKQAKELPWGSHVSESIHVWEIHRHVKHYVWDGFIVGGGGATLEGLGHLVGIGGSAKDAWSGLADVVSGIGQYTMTPVDWALDHTIGPDEESATEKRQKTAAREFAKAMVAWDQWEEHPVQAAGTATFNILTLGAGPLGAVAKGGKGGAAAKAAGVGAKIGTYADPLSAGLTVGGKAFSKLPSVADLTARVRTGTNSTPELRRVHSDLEFDGSRVRIEDGKFIRVDAEGNPINDTAPVEKAADERAAPEGTSPQREPAMANSGARGPEAHAHAGGNLPPQASHGNPTGGSSADAPIGPGGGANRAGGTGTVGSGTSKPPSGAAGNGHVGAGSDGHGGGAGEPRKLTAEELKEIRDEHVRLANENPEWRDKYYRQNDYQRKNAYAKYKGHFLTELKMDADGNFIAKHDRPRAAPETRFNPTPYAPDSAPRTVRTYLDGVSKVRRQGMDLTAAEKAYKKDASPENLESVKKARETLGDHVNNSKLGEKLGEDAARYHVVPQRFENPKWIELPKTPNGADAFDQLWEIKDDGLVIAEAKGPKGDLEWRQEQVIRDGVKVSTGKMVKQGTREYIETICAEMLDRAIRSPRDGVLALRILDALENKKLHYVMVKANENTGTYAGSVLEHLKIY
ncbi:hypothetical protein [Streptomyces sp. MZ04]|uniref:hypothetical protein n=1 Tax=Streptomyces sp. MZ04 TaxID=2559236 RepID=UPI00107E8BD4|nr:hypothetical protein [Streptomyces sp. MZ04]TGA95183.1 hypothetical protein E2651_34810 [Streptomyces sp. MZ04]